MNLGEYLANILLEAGDQPEQTIALFPGAFKPPHKGHFDVVEKLLKAADQVVVLVSPKMREGVSADESIAIWDLYKPLFDGSVEVRVAASDSPVSEVYDVVKNNPDTQFIVAFGKGEMDRYKNIEKYPNVKIFDAGAVEGVSATNLRMALAQKNEEEIAKYIPNNISVDEFLQALGEKPKEEKPEEAPAEQPPAEETPEQPLKESPPINFEQDDYQDYILANRRKIEQAAAVFNIPIDDMEYAFNGGNEVVLNDDMWSEMENTKSYNTKTLSDAISHALKIGIDPKPYIDAIKKQEDIPLPLVLQYQQGKYYLVGGEVILSIYRSLGVIPTVLLATLNLQTKQLHQPTSLGEGLIREYSKSQLNYITTKLGIKNNNEFNSLMNALDSQGIKYPDLKNKIINGEINSFNDIKSLKKQSKSDVSKTVKSDSKVVYEDDNFFIIIPFTHAASCYYGKGTKWCTTSNDVSHWKRYIIEGKGVLYYIFDKRRNSTDPLYKVAFLKGYNGDPSDFEMWDARDKVISATPYFDNIEKEIGYDLWEKVKGFPNINKQIRPVAKAELQSLNEGLDTDNDKKLLKKFVGFAIKELGIQKPPSGLTLSNNNTKAKSRHTFGTFNPNNDKIWLYVKNRNMADLLRTLAHELVHRKQAEDGRIDYNSGETGSEIENEANAMAGVLLRKFGKQNEEIYQ